MTKILLVEDDKSLREIYGVRLRAEGYDIVSAGDGEEALALAIKERPELVISDVMMPKVSGFDMLDILRSTSETKNIRVIVMTALSSEEQRQRGEMLGADRYLVKSQVGIEDVVRAVHEVMGDAPVSTSEPAAPFAMPLMPTPPVTPQQPALPVSPPAVEPTPSPIDDLPLSPVGQPLDNSQAAPPLPDPVLTYSTIPSPADVQPQAPVQPQPIVQTPLPQPQEPVQPQPIVQAPVVVNPSPASNPFPASSASVQPQPAPVPVPASPPINIPATPPVTATQNPATPSDSTNLADSMDPPGITSRPGNRVIQPIGDPNRPTFDIGNLLDKEFAKDLGVDNVSQPSIMTIAEEQAAVDERVQSYSDQQLTNDPSTDALESLPSAPLFDSTPQTPSEVSSSEIDSATPSANIPSVPLQTRESMPVIMPPQKSDQPSSALSGTTLPPT